MCVYVCHQFHIHEKRLVETALSALDFIRVRVFMCVYVFMFFFFLNEYSMCICVQCVYMCMCMFRVFMFVYIQQSVYMCMHAFVSLCLMCYLRACTVYCVWFVFCLSLSLPLSLCMCDVMKKHASTPFVCSVVASKEGHRFGCDKLAK